MGRPVVRAVRSLGVDRPAVSSLSLPLPVPCLRLPALHRGEAALGCFDSKSFLFFFLISSFFQPRSFQPFPSLVRHLGLPLIVTLRGAGLTSHLTGLTCSRWSISANPGHPLSRHFLSSFHARQTSLPFMDGFRAHGQRALQVALQIILFKTILSSIL